MAIKGQRPLRICIDARLTEGMGGVRQFIIGLADGLSDLAQGDEEEYFFLADEGADEYIRPYVRGACSILHGAAATRQPSWMNPIRKLPAARSLLRKMAPVARAVASSLPRSDGSIERADFDLIHFTTPNAFLTTVPSIYHPWDLQHLHLPQFFSVAEYQKRERAYRAFCEQARIVSVATSWIKQDVEEQYKLPAEKVQVVPVASVVSAYAAPSIEDMAAAKTKFSLPDSFVFYPAQTWAHKNHAGLLESLAMLRDRDRLIVPLVSSGLLNDFFPQLEKQVRELGLTEQVKFLNFVSPVELQCLYALCRMMVFPSKFEGWGLPLTEAFTLGVPVACSNVTSLPALADDAALIFDPDDPEEIAEAIKRLWNDETLRRDLIARGKKRAALFTWERTARMFRAHYKRIARRDLTVEEQELLQAPPLV